MMIADESYGMSLHATTKVMRGPLRVPAMMTRQTLTMISNTFDAACSAATRRHVSSGHSRDPHCHIVLALWRHCTSRHSHR